MATSAMVASLFLTSALSAPIQVRQTQDLSITALSATLPTSGTDGSGPIASSLQITLSYPDPSSTGSTLSTTCSVAWDKETTPGPTDWAQCVDSRVQWRLPASGYVGQLNFLVEVFETLTDDGAGVDGSHQLDFNPANSTDPAAYLSCIQMGKFNPYTCNLGGTLAPHQPPVSLTTTSLVSKPQ